MGIRWRRTFSLGLMTGLLALMLLWIPTWRYQPEFGLAYRAINAVCKTCNPIPREAVIALLDDGPSTFATCLVVEGMDPSPTLLAKVRTVDKTAVPASQCTRTDETGYQTPDGKQALHVSIQDWTRVSRTRATVLIADSPGFILGGSGFTCTLYKRGSEWKVDKCRMDWIS